MNPASLRERSAGWIVVSAMLASAVVGVCAGIKPVLGIEVAAVIGLALVTVSNVTAGLIMFTVLSFLEVLNGNGSTSYTKLFGLVLFGSWFAARASQRPELRTRLRSMTPPLLVVSAIGLIGWCAASAAWADDPGIATKATTRYLLEIILIPIVLAAIRRREHVQWFLAAFVVGAVVSTVLGVLHPVASGGDYGRLAGTIGDANEQAAVLVAAIPMAVALAETLRHRPGLRLLCWAAALLCLVGTLNTLSRGGLVALAVTLLAAVVFGGRWRAIAAVLLLVVAIGSVGYYVVVASPTSQHRVTMSDTSGRTAIWTVAWRIAQAHPFTGVGADNFQTSAVHYVQAPGNLTYLNFIVDQPHVAHNIYLEFLADLGIPGLVAFLGIVLAAFTAALRAARRFQRAGNTELEIVARALLLSIVAFMTADFFLSGQYSKQLWLTIAICPAVLNLSASAVPAAAARPDRAPRGPVGPSPRAQPVAVAR